MQYCPKCRVKIRGNKSCCPLCRATLTGEGEDGAFPVLRQFRETLMGQFLDTDI